MDEGERIEARQKVVNNFMATVSYESVIDHIGHITTQKDWVVSVALIRSFYLEPNGVITEKDWVNHLSGLGFRGTQDSFDRYWIDLTPVPEGFWAKLWYWAFGPFEVSLGGPYDPR